MLFKTSASLLAVASNAVALSPYRPHSRPQSSLGFETSFTATGTADVAKAAATAKTTSPTSHVKGKAFDRFVVIYFENTDYDKSIGDPNFAWFAKKGITLSNYFAVTHPSEPNYMASLAGDYFGMNNDDFTRAPSNISTLIDLLDTKRISWAQYQEDMPFSGFEGFSWINHQTGANDYVRKHNPAILFDSVTQSEQRLSQIKNLSLIDTSRSMFHQDLKENKLPQWMFITPNMTSDGHDSSVTVAGTWCRKFLEPLLEDKNFMQNTLVLITWDENETFAIQNNVLGILLGDAVPKKLVGTVDSHFYNHYSEIATVSANWDLPTLGRWDVGANVYKLVADKTGDRLRQWPSQQQFQSMFWNLSYAGQFNDQGGNKLFPKPNLGLDKACNGRHILQSVKDTWKHSDLPTYYKDTIETPDGLHPPPGYEPQLD